MKITRQIIIEEIKRIARDLDKNQLSRQEFHSNSNISDWYIYKLFDGWNEAAQEAGLMPHTEKDKITDDDLFIEMEKVFLDLGNICNRTKFDKTAKYSVGVYKKRFGRWSDILKAFRNWLEENNKVFPFIDQLPKSTDQSLTSDQLIHTDKTEKVTSWDSIGGTTYGSFLNFKGLQHAPLNEQGVVFLFGMICLELGFIVEAIRNEYPDCEAKRRIGKTNDQWERVRIEFEYCSSNFKAHGHDPSKCDLIVCWIHDWRECPLEVVELKSIINKMSANI